MSLQKFAVICQKTVHDSDVKSAFLNLKSNLAGNSFLVFSNLPKVFEIIIKLIPLAFYTQKEEETLEVVRMVSTDLVLLTVQRGFLMSKIFYQISCWRSKKSRLFESFLSLYFEVFAEQFHCQKLISHA